MALDLKKLVSDFFGKDLYWYQIRFLNDCLTKKRVLGAFCRQTGKSMTIAIFSIIEAMRNPNGHIVIVAPTDRQAGELFQKIQTFLVDSPWKSEIKSMTQRSVTMNNGCRFSILPCGDSGDNIRGMTATILILEEAAFIKDIIVNQVLMPMVAATGGKVIKISTPMGMNHFYKSYQSNEWESHVVSYEDPILVGHFAEEFIEEQKRQIGESSLEFRTEYGAEFIADQDNYFGFDLIEKCTNDIPPMFVPETGKSYYMGLDVARFGSDSSVFTVIEKGATSKPHKVVHIREENKKSTDQVIKIAGEMHDIWHFKKIYVDDTGLGAGVFDGLKKELNEKIDGSQTNSGLKYGKRDIVIGITFSVKSKLDIYSNLKLLMEQGNLLLPNNKRMIFQMRDFRYELTSSGNMKLHHSDGGRDDYCDSLALAVRGLKEESRGSFFFG